MLMHQHIAASKGHDDCVLALLKHGCNVHLRGNFYGVQVLHLRIHIRFTPLVSGYTFIGYRF